MKRNMTALSPFWRTMWMFRTEEMAMDASMLMTLMQPPKLEGLKKVLCIQPHPDDNEIGMGGIIAKMIAEGTEVDYLTITDGSLGDCGLHDRKEGLVAARRRETEEAGRFLGVKTFLSLEKQDGTLKDVPALAREIAEVLRKGCYDGVAAPDPWNSYEAHYDHVTVGLAAAQAAISVNLPGYPEGTKTAPITLEAVMFYFTQKPNTVVPITPFFQKKMAAVALHKSQISPEMLQLYTGYFAFRGQRLTGSEEIGEGLKVLAPLHLHCIPEAGEI